MIEVVEYIGDNGKNAYQEFLETLDTKTFARILACIARIKNGNFGDVAPVGEGVSERRIDFGPGYRVYFGKDGNKLVILLGGGRKRRQQNDIKAAKLAWAQYKATKGRKEKDGN